jgi:membrane protein required for colicin V production
MGSLHTVDIVFGLVVVASTLHAAFRGITREILSILTLLLAILVSVHCGAFATGMLEPHVGDHTLSVVAGYAVAFLVVFLPLSLYAASLSHQVKKSRIGPLNVTLGAIFGTVQGLAIVAVMYLVFSWMVPPPRQPAWMTEARTLPLIQDSARAVGVLLPEDWGVSVPVTPPHGLKKIAPRLQEDPDTDKVNGATPQKGVTEKSGKKATPDEQGKKTYGARDRHALDRLIEETGKGKNGKP